LYSDGDGFTDDWFCLRVVETGGFAYGGLSGGVEEDGAGEGVGGLYGSAARAVTKPTGGSLAAAARQDVGWRRALLSICWG
jgi:hypothetical protein